MLIVLLFCFSFLFVEFFSNHFGGKRNRKRVQLLLCFLLLFVFFGFRYLSVLNDTAHYYNYAREVFRSALFDKTPWYYFDSEVRFEEGFQVFTRFLGHFISKDPYVLILVTSLITTITTLWFLKKITANIAFCIFVLLTSTLLFTIYSAVRQSLAISMSYLLFYFYQRRRFPQAIFCGIAAYFFHYSAIILILPFILYHIPFTKQKIIAILTATIAISIFIYPVLLILGFGDSRYYETGMDRTSPPIAHILDTIFVVVCLLTYYWVNKRYRLNLADNKLFLSFAFSSLIMNICAIPCLILGRYSLYFSQYAVVLFVNSLFVLPAEKSKKIIIFSVVLILLARIFIVLEYRNEWFHLIPYSFFDFSLEFQRTDFGY